MSVDPMQGRLLDPQTFNRYAYARNNPLRYVDPFGLYEVDPACLEDKRCAAEAERFERERKRALDSRNARVAAAAAAYGDPGVANGVTVNFASAKAVEATCGQGSPGCAKSRYISTDGGLSMQPAVNVLIRSGMRSTDLHRTVVHEGSHVRDALLFVGSWDPAQKAFNSYLNVSHYGSEFRAYWLETLVDTDPHRLRGRTPGETSSLIDRFLRDPRNGYTGTLNQFMFDPEFTKPR